MVSRIGTLRTLRACRSSCGCACARCSCRGLLRHRDFRLRTPARPWRLVRRRLAFRRCARKLGGWPHRRWRTTPALHRSPTKPFSAVGSENTQSRAFQCSVAAWIHESPGQKANGLAPADPPLLVYFSSALAPRPRPASSGRLRRRPWQPSLTFFRGAVDQVLASFRPRPVSRTALMTDTLLAPASSSTTLNSVFSQRPAAAAPPPPAGGRGHRSGGHAELLFDRLDQVVEFHDGSCCRGRSGMRLCRMPCLGS